MQKVFSLSRSYILYLSFLFASFTTFGQSHSILLGRPTDVSITASVLFDHQADFYLEYGIASGAYTSTTTTYSNTANIPDEIDLQNLIPNTKYYYRMQYRSVGSGTFSPTPEYTFHTQRPAGAPFTFVIEADEHLYDKKGCENLYRIALRNQAADNPDFMITLGDIFGDDHEPLTTTAFQMDSLHYAYRPVLDELCHSVPFYVCLGNHEGENDYYLNQTPPNNIAVYGTLARKKYYPNPYPNNFYSGNTTSEGFGMDLPENYYAWTWGDALFVVLDVYRTESYDSLSPKPTNWNWTLGLDQYNWLAGVLQNSTAQHKFVFAHHVRGQGRGGILDAGLFEWGGYQNSGNYTFPTNRPGWAMPIHQLFTTYGVDIFFQGHDHLFAREVLDGVIYQEVPMPSDSTYEIGMLANASAYVSDTIGGSGHLRVTVDPTCVTVDFVRAYLPADTIAGVRQNREVAFSYTVGNCTSGVTSTDNHDTFTVYPNPANNTLSIKSPVNTPDYTIYITNILGEVLMKTTQHIIDTSALPNGSYSVCLQTPTSINYKHIVIQH
jgi:hypothetical protein